VAAQPVPVSIRKAAYSRAELVRAQSTVPIEFRGVLDITYGRGRTPPPTSD
jgi:hypothetical protein